VTVRCAGMNGARVTGDSATARQASPTPTSSSGPGAWGPTVCLCLAAVLIAGAVSEPAADLVLVNGRVYTLDAARPWAEAIAIRGDRLARVGSTADVEALVGPSTRRLDLGGAFALPGFDDAHVHADATGALLTGVNLLDVHEPVAFAARIAAAAGRLPKGSWITRGDWGAYEQWAAGSSGAGEPRGGEGARPRFLPDRALIDAVTPDHPVLVNRFDRSEYLANTRALELAGITADTPAPPGGAIGRDAGGRPTGILSGTAAELVQKVIPPVPFEQRLVQVRSVLREAREAGVTTIQDLTSAEQLRAYQELHRRGELTARLLLRPTLFMVPHVAKLGLDRGFGHDWLKFIGYKAWVDGIMGNSSALFFRPYDHDPANKGVLRDVMLPEAVEGAADRLTETSHYTEFPPGNLEQLLEAAVQTGLTPHVHAIGDRGNRILLDVYERVLTRAGLAGKDHRWRVIHAQVVHPRDIARFGRLGLVAEVNPYHVSDDMRWMEERIGSERSRGAYAFRSLKDAGAVLVFGSDSPGTNAARYYLNPTYGLYAAVTRQTVEGEPAGGWFPEQRLTIEEALDAAIRAPAWASFEEATKGTLAPGKLADVAVFDTDLVEAGQHAPRRLLDAKVLYTIAGGKVVYEKQ
jgi:predicted amidohydrolase YtcJ